VAYSWLQRQLREGPERGYVETLFGNRCRLPSVGGLSHIEKCSANYIPQSSAAGVVKRAMLKCDELGMDQALQVHDEILVDGVVQFPEELAHILPGVHTPFKSTIGPNWS
jgi:DNA polymerase-1